MEALVSISNFKKPVFLVLTLFVILACNTFTGTTPQPAATLNALYTSAAQTLNAMATQGAVALTQQPSPTGTLSIPTSSPIAFQTFTVVPPVQPSTRCDAGAFIADVTYPDGSSVGMGVVFTKIWRIKNVGTCTWTTSYALVFSNGEKFGAKNSVPVLGNVGPGETVDLPVQLTAPNQGGRYKGYWMLRNASGVLFGVGNSGQESIYVDVNISGYTVLGYDFLEKYCDAQWSNASQDLPCPGSDGDAEGFVFVQNSPKMEDGSAAPSKGLMTFPQGIKNGLISGKYPGFNIQTGDHFQAWINCMYKANDCNMIYKLQYQIGGGKVQTLGQWNEIYEGQYYSINIDLSSLNGQKVKFILTVLANGSPHEDYALWIAPRITRLSAQAPTASFTPSLTATVTSTSTATGTATPTVTITSTTTSTTTPTATFTPTPTETPTATATP
jgi:Ig-like domain-containing protein